MEGRKLGFTCLLLSSFVLNSLFLLQRSKEEVFGESKLQTKEVNRSRSSAVESFLPVSPREGVQELGKTDERSLEGELRECQQANDQLLQQLNRSTPEEARLKVMVEETEEVFGTWKDPKRSRTAICFSGLVRTWPEVYESQKRHLLENLSLFAPDVFFVLDESERNASKLPDIFQSLKPVSAKFVGQDSEFFRTRFKERLECRSSWNTINQAHKVYECLFLIKDYERKMNFTYDRIVRARTDTRMTRTIDYRPLFRDLVWMRPPWWAKENSLVEINDFFWISNRRDAELLFGHDESAEFNCLGREEKEAEYRRYWPAWYGAQTFEYLLKIRMRMSRYVPHASYPFPCVLHRP